MPIGTDYLDGKIRRDVVLAAIIGRVVGGAVIFPLVAPGAVCLLLRVQAFSPRA